MSRINQRCLDPGSCQAYERCWLPAHIHHDLVSRKRQIYQNDKMGEPFIILIDLAGLDERNSKWICEATSRVIMSGIIFAPFILQKGRMNGGVSDT